LVAAVVVSVNPKAPAVARVEPAANVKVAAVAGAVNATLLILVAVATPKTGVTRVGVVANTLTPVPVLSVSAAAKLADEGVAKNVATLAAKPETPVEIGRPVQLVRVPDVGVPNNGVVSVGEVANTKSPVPVSSVTAVIKFADDGVAKNAATPAAKPETPVEIGRPVQLVRVPEDGVPKAGVTRVGDVANTKRPLPVSSDITPANSAEEVAACTDNLLPEVISVPAVGNVTLVAAVVVSVKLKAPEVANVDVSANVRVADVAGAVKATLLTLVAEATPRVGVTRDGEVANTKRPLPVSSDITPANSAEEVAACTDNLSVVTTRVLLVGIVVELIVPETVALAYTSVLVFGLYVRSVSEDKATPAPVAEGEKIKECDEAALAVATLTLKAVVAAPVNDPSKFATMVPTVPV